MSEITENSRLSQQNCLAVRELKTYHTEEAAQNITLNEILKELKQLGTEVNIRVLVQCKELLQTKIQENDVLFEESENLRNVLNECIEWATTHIFNLSQVNKETQIIYRELLFLLLCIKLECFDKDSIESDDIIFSIIHNSSKLVKLCNECEQYKNADSYANRSLQIYEAHLKKQTESGKTVTRCETLLQKKITIFLHHIETLVCESKFLEAVQKIQNIKSSIHEFPCHEKYFICLCYNVGLKCLKAEEHELALTVLKTAKELGKLTTHFKDYMIQVLRLLVHIYLKYKPEINWSQAIKELDSEYPDTDFYYFSIKIKAALLSKNDSIIRNVLNQLAEWENITLKYVLNVVYQLKMNSYLEKCADFITKVMENMSSNSDKFALMRIELQIYLYENEEQKARKVLEKALEMARKADPPLSEINNICNAVLSYTAGKLKNRLFEECLTWFKHCSEFYCKNNLDESLYTYIQKLICFCFIEMNQYEIAEQTFSKLKWDFVDDDSLNLYLALQIAVLSENDNLAESALEHLGSGNKNCGPFLLACCYRAFLSGKTDFISRIMEAVLTKSNSFGGLTNARIAQCLIRLRLDVLDSEETKEKLLLYMDKAIEALQNEYEHQEQVAEMSLWFSRMAWTLALTPQNEALQMFNLFLRCSCFFEMTSGNISRLKNSLTLTAAAGLHAVRGMKKKKNGSNSMKEIILSKVITVIRKCQSLEDGTNLTLVRLLYLYEFAARIQMNDEYTDCDIKDILQNPVMDVKTLQHIAATAYEYNPNNYKVVVQVLKCAIEKIIENPNPDGVQASRTYHSLVQELFVAQEYLNPSAEEENLQICCNLQKLIESNLFPNYPQLEVLWLMTKCWNWGIRKLALGDKKQAYKWCSLAMAFQQRLSSLKSLHERSLQNMYSTYFADLLSD